MPLKLKRIGIDTYKENIALLSRACTLYRPEDFQALKKIQVSNNSKRLFATLMVVDEPGLIAPDELGLSEQAFDHFGMAEGSEVSIGQAQPPRSLEAVRRKILGHALTSDEIDSIIIDIASRRYSEMEIAAFLTSSASFLTPDEVLSLTQAMSEVGTRLDWDETHVVDKHCIGGIPGNRTSMIVVPIVAAHGLPIPKTSSRAITSPAGTADTMEVLANVDLGIDDIRQLVKEERGCLAWGGHVNLSPADDILISVERPLRIDTREQMVASILSKKLAAGSTHLLIDIPIGPSAKIRTHSEAVRLRKLFEFVATKIGLVIDPVFTDGSQPIGRGIGPALEARDVMAVLRNEPKAPQDLKEKSLFLAGRILDFDPALKGGTGEARAKEILESGEALKKMERLIEKQGDNTNGPGLGPLIHEVCAPKDGTISAIDCFRISRIASLAGAPLDKGAGIDLLKKLGEHVRQGEPLYRIHACVKTDLDFATDLAREESGFVCAP